MVQAQESFGVGEKPAKRVRIDGADEDISGDIEGNAGVNDEESKILEGEAD